METECEVAYSEEEKEYKVAHSEEECKWNAIVLGEIVTTNPLAKNDLFWVLFEIFLRKGVPKYNSSTNIARRFKRMMPIWLTNYLMKTRGLEANCARIVKEYAGVGKDCQECGSTQDLRLCSLCAHRICDYHIKYCYICVMMQMINPGRPISFCCSLCACAWCSRGVCIAHHEKCFCGRKFCWLDGTGGCKKNNTEPLAKHGFCLDFFQYLRTCPSCRPALRLEICQVCWTDFPRYGPNCFHLISPCWVCKKKVCKSCSCNCVACEKKICKHCARSNVVFKCRYCTMEGRYCGKCRKTCGICSEALVTKTKPRRRRKRKDARRKKRKDAKLKCKKREVASRTKKTRKRTSSKSKKVPAKRR